MVVTGGKRKQRSASVGDAAALDPATALATAVVAAAVSATDTLEDAGSAPPLDESNFVIATATAEAAAEMPIGSMGGVGGEGGISGVAIGEPSIGLPEPPTDGPMVEGVAAIAEFGSATDMAMSMSAAEMGAASELADGDLTVSAMTSAADLATAEAAQEAADMATVQAAAAMP